MDVTTTVGCEMNMPHVFTIDQSNDLKSGLTTAEFSVSFPTKGWLSLSAKCCSAVGWGYRLALLAGAIGLRYWLAPLAVTICWGQCMLLTLWVGGCAVGWCSILALWAYTVGWHCELLELWAAGAVHIGW